MSLYTVGIEPGKSLTVDIQIKNTGSRDGEATVEVYVVPRNMPGAPLRALVRFQKVHVEAGVAQTVHVQIEPRQLSLVSQDGSRSIHAGEYELYLAGDQT